LSLGRSSPRVLRISSVMPNPRREMLASIPIALSASRSVRTAAESSSRRGSGRSPLAHRPATFRSR
jgi:hypothetical protein